MAARYTMTSLLVGLTAGISVALRRQRGGHGSWQLERQVREIGKYYSCIPRHTGGGEGNVHVRRSSPALTSGAVRGRTRARPLTARRESISVVQRLDDNAWTESGSFGFTPKMASTIKRACAKRTKRARAQKAARAIE